MSQIFCCQRRVTYAECAPGDHVYYARYLDYLEFARGELFRSLGSSFLSWQQQNIAFPVVACQFTFKAPARYDDLLTLEVALEELARVRIKFSYRILHETRPLVLGSTTHACTSGGDKIQSIPESLRQSLSPYLQQTPA